MHNNEFAHEIKVTNKIMIFTSAHYRVDYALIQCIPENHL